MHIRWQGARHARCHLTRSAEFNPAAANLDAGPKSEMAGVYTLGQGGWCSRCITAVVSRLPCHVSPDLVLRADRKGSRRGPI